MFDKNRPRACAFGHYFSFLLCGFHTRMQDCLYHKLVSQVCNRYNVGSVKK